MTDSHPEDDAEQTTKKNVGIKRPLAFNKSAVRRSEEVTAAEIDETARRLAEARRHDELCRKHTDELLIAIRERAPLEKIRHLVEQEDIDLDVHYRNGNGLLHLAVESGNLNALAILINHGLDLHVKNFDGVTPLLAAAGGYDRCDAAVMLADADPDLSVHVYEGIHVLHVAAASFSKTRLVEKLLERGVSPVVEDPDGRTPLFYAIAEKLDCVDVLCAAGGYREKDMNALKEAIAFKKMCGNEWDYEYLLERVGRLDRDKLERDFPKQGPVLPTLPDAATEEVFNVVNNRGASFRMERFYGKPESLEARNHDGQTPLMALLDGSGDVWAARSAAWSSDRNARDHADRTALHYAVRHTDASPIVDSCLSRDTVNATDIIGRTPLMITVERGCNYMDRLMDAGADLSLKDRLGLTVMDIAKVRKSDYAISKLEEEMARRSAKKPANGWAPR